MNNRNKTLFNELQAEWYKKLNDEPDGFKDIENTKNPDSPLIEWHSFKYTSEQAQLRMAKRSEYQNQIDSFANDPAFPEILVLMVKHGNNLFEEPGIEKIWSLHRQGVTERTIAIEMGCSKTCIHVMLIRMREWMKLI